MKTPSDMYFKVPRGMLVLGEKDNLNDAAEEGRILSSEAARIDAWWNDSRWKFTKRIYKGTDTHSIGLYSVYNLRLNSSFSAMDVAALRSSPEARSGLQVSPNSSYSDSSSKKLYSLLRNLHDKSGYSHTFGALDPVQVIQMAPHLSSIYVSGWQSSSTASTTNEPGPDFADYPMNTVPQKVKEII